MIQTISQSDFTTAFHRMDRGEQFSYEALGLIFDHFEQYEEATGDQVELYPIAICCEISEESPQEIARNYGIDLEDDGNELNNVLDYINDHTTIIGTTSEDKIVYFKF